MNKYLLIGFTLVILTACDIAYAINDPIVYSRCVRSDHSLDVTRDVTINGSTQAVTKTFTGIDGLDVLPDVKNFLGDFNAPCDLVLRQPNGSEQIIHDCSTNSTQADACAALDAAVSFDAEKISYAVFRGPLAEIEEYFYGKTIHPDADNVYVPPAVGLGSFTITTAGSHICTYTISDQSTACVPYVNGIWDSGPIYLPNGRIAFTSTRDGNNHTKLFHSNLSELGNRIYSMDQDFKNFTLDSHHSLSIEQHPFVLANGRVAYSSWQILMSIPFRHSNGSAGFFTTPRNVFMVWGQDQYGANNFPLYGQHSGDHSVSSFGASSIASHFLTQTSDRRIWTADYYRGNNKGLGIVVGFMQEPDGQEGIHPSDNPDKHADWYVVRDAINFASWATNRDNAAFLMPNAPMASPIYSGTLPWAGKIGHPSALPNNELMLVWGKGHCGIIGRTEVFTYLGLPIPSTSVSGSGQGVAINMITELGMDTPGCDAGIYKATTIPSSHPSDLELIVDTREWHEIMPRAVVPYSAIYGIPQPVDTPRVETQVSHPDLPPGTAFGLLGAASMTDRETAPEQGFTFGDVHDEHQFGLQGTDTIPNIQDDDIAAVRILGIMPNRGPYTEIDNAAGERLAILAEIPTKNLDGQGNPIIDPSGHPDTSFLINMPANMPYLMQAIDSEGRTLNTDQSWQYLRPGQKKTCGGCHVHSKPSRITFEQSYADTPAYTIPKIGRGTVPLIDGSTLPGYGAQYEFTRDVKPILDEHCVSCHGGATPAAGLDLSKTGTKNNVSSPATTWFCLAQDRTGLCTGTAMRRPQLTKYLKAFNSRGSLFYWKAANQRTDGFTDEDRVGDIDFGDPHPTSITQAQLGVISRWIDLGAPGGDLEIRDTQKPGLNVVAVKSDDTITSMKIGISDLGSGADPSSGSLTVGGVNVPISLINNDVADVTLSSPITDPDTEIVISVSDMAGNNTRLERTANFFLNLPVTAIDSNYVVVPIYDDQGLDTGGFVRVKLILEGAIPVHDALGRPTGLNVGAVVTNE